MWKLQTRTGAMTIIGLITDNYLRTVLIKGALQKPLRLAHPPILNPSPLFFTSRSAFSFHLLSACSDAAWLRFVLSR